MAHVIQCPKCNTIHVTSSPKPIIFDYSIHNTVLENVPHAKYLGVATQSNLKWDVHCKQIAAQVTNTLNLLFKRNLRSTKEIPEKACKSLLRLHVKYTGLVWSPWLAKDKTRIERVQRRAASDSVHYLQSLPQHGHVPRYNMPPRVRNYENILGFQLESHPEKLAFRIFQAFRIKNENLSYQELDFYGLSSRKSL